MLLGFFLSSFFLLPLAQGTVIPPSSPRPSPPSPVIAVATRKQRQLQGLLALSRDAGPSWRENLREGEKRRKMGLEKNTPFGKRQIEMFKGRWQGERKEENRAASGNCWDQSL